MEEDILVRITGGTRGILREIAKKFINKFSTILILTEYIYIIEFLHTADIKERYYFDTKKSKKIEKCLYYFFNV